MITRHTPRIAAAMLLAFASSLFAQDAQKTSVNSTQISPTGIYAPGDPIAWTLAVKGDAASLTKVPYVVKKNLMTELDKGELDLSKGAVVVKTSLDEPGTVAVYVKLKPDDKDFKVVGGAVVAPEQIKPSKPAPDDFDKFWADKIEQIKAIPLNAQVEKADAEKPNVEYYKLTLDNINGTKVYGQLARPAKEGKFPALLMVQYAGVYGLPKTNVTGRAQQGFLALNIMAHDLPFDRDADFYKQQNDTTLKGYTAIGNTDREKSYFLRMYLGCYQAARYLSERDDWDGKIFVVSGGSQGGQQALATAGLFPGVTHVLAGVPAGCDAAGPLYGRFSGFPYWRGWNKEPNKEAIAVGEYFDNVNFAPRIKARTLVSAGLRDTTCPAIGIIAAFNQIPAEKELVTLPDGEHQNVNNAHKRYHEASEEWMRALAKGEEPARPRPN